MHETPIIQAWPFCIGSTVMQPFETGHQYDAIAPLWDENRRTSSHVVRFVERAIALCRARRRALDVGCGSGGQMMEKLLAAGFAVTGIDVSTGMLDIAKSRHPSVEFVHDDITEWESTLRFDLILAWDSIFHLPHGSHALVIGKLCSYLSEGGVLLFSAGGIDGKVVGPMHGHEFHYSSLSDTRLIELIKRGGCVPVLMERDQYPLHHLAVIGVKAELGPV
ncbi:MAG: class I SAM-dependent methyltransferase [Burkholderiales bacterium]